MLNSKTGNRIVDINQLKDEGLSLEVKNMDDIKNAINSYKALTGVEDYMLNIELDGYWMFEGDWIDFGRGYRDNNFKLISIGNKYLKMNFDYDDVKGCTGLLEPMDWYGRWSVVQITIK